MSKKLPIYFSDDAWSSLQELMGPEGKPSPTINTVLEQIAVQNELVAQLARRSLPRSLGRRGIAGHQLLYPRARRRELIEYRGRYRQPWPRRGATVAERRAGVDAAIWWRALFT